MCHSGIMSCIVDGIANCIACKVTSCLLCCTFRLCGLTSTLMSCQQLVLMMLLSSTSWGQQQHWQQDRSTSQIRYHQLRCSTGSSRPSQHQDCLLRRCNCMEAL